MSYRHAIRVMQPSRAEMARRHAPGLEADRQARAAIKAELAAGADARTLYDAENAKGDARDKRRASALLGFLRRGAPALE